MSAREQAILIFETAVAAVHPRHLIPAHLFIKDAHLFIAGREFDLKALPAIYVIGAGKASASMAQEVEAIIGQWITAGLIVTKYDHSLPLNKINCIEAAHPVPDEQSVLAGKKTIELLNAVQENDIVLCLLSGGASALWADHPESITLEELQEMSHLLLKCGATIAEINAVRKHFSAFKGGQLLRHAPTANWFSFLISDVPGDTMATIGSGPTVPDTSSFADVKFILARYGLTDVLPSTVSAYLDQGVSGKIPDTPKAGDPIFNHVVNLVVGSNSIALKAAEIAAKNLGFHVPFIEDTLNGDAAMVGREFTRSCKKYTGPKPACFLLGGETTVIVKGDGAGGRNQHMALSALHEMTIDDEPAFSNRLTFLAAGTDGTDGPTTAAGAIADAATLSKAIDAELDPKKYLEAFDAHSFFKQVDGLVITGPTQTNVMDIVVVLVE